MDLLIQRSTRRRRALGAAFLALALGAGACVSVLGLSDDRYEDIGTAVCDVCRSLVEDELVWGMPCDAYFQRSGASPLTLLDCVNGSGSCEALLECLAPSVTFYGDGGVSAGALCLDVCTTQPPCAPWLCSDSMGSCVATGEPADAGPDAAVPMRCMSP
jgi:hypothetical protein